MDLYQILSNDAQFCSGRKINHVSKGFFDSGFVSGFFDGECGEMVYLKNFLSTHRVEKNTLKIVYPEIESFKKSDSSFCLLEVLFKYGEVNEVNFLDFKTEKEQKMFLKSFKDETKDTKWSSSIFEKGNSQPIKSIYLDL